MAGLLGDNWDDPRTIATLQMAAGLLGGGNFGQAASRGLGDYQKSMAVATEQQRRQRELAMQEAEQRQRAQVQAMQMQAAQQEAARKQAVEGAWRGAFESPATQALAGGQGPTQQAAQGMQGMQPRVNQDKLIRSLIQADPMMAAQMLQPKPDDYKVVGDSLVSIGGGGVKEAYRAPQKQAEAPGAVREFEYGQANPAFNAWKNAQAQASAPRTSVNVNAGQRFENAYSTEQGKSFSETMGNINKTAFSAPAQLRKLERMEALLEGVDGGKLAPVGLEVASMANAIGIKIDPKLGNKEAAQALSREIAGGFRQPGTGPMTDKDFDNFLLQVPDLSKTAEGRKQITTTMRGALSRDIQIAKMARDYERRNGRLDNGFLDEAAQYIAENPVIGAPMGWKVR